MDWLCTGALLVLFFYICCLLMRMGSLERRVHALEIFTEMMPSIAITPASDPTP